MKIIKTKIDGVLVIEPDMHFDFRGYFGRFFCKKEMFEAGIDFNIVQINRSFTKNKGTIRGFHYQKGKKWEKKIVQCLSGSIYNVVVDLRKKSPTYKEWFAVELSEKNKKMLLTEKGIANGFQSLKNNSEILYFMSQYHHPSSASGFKFDDPSVGVVWPIKKKFLSERDKELPFLK